MGKVRVSGLSAGLRAPALEIEQGAPADLSAREQDSHSGRQPAIIENLSVELPGQRTSVIMGPGGSGKSTLLRAIRVLHCAGRDDAEEGDFWARGMVKLPTTALRHVSQHLPQSSKRLAEVLARSTKGNASDDPLDNARATLEGFWQAAPEAGRNLQDYLEQPLEQLPGPLRRVAVFTAQLVDLPPAACLLLDEPDANMECEQRSWITAKLQALRCEYTILVVTHHLGLAREVADFAALLVDGQLVEAAESQRFFEQPQKPRTQYFVRMGC